MAEYNDEDLDLGRHLAQRLAYQSFRRPLRPADDAGFPVDDVSDQFESFDRDERIVELLRLPGYPAIKVSWTELPVTVALSGYFPPVQQLVQDAEIFVRQDVAAWLARMGEISFVDRSEARNSLITLAAEFIASRRAGVRELNELKEDKRTMLNLAYGATPGCTFDVYTKSRGLRVHWSGAYRISGNYFGHPTSPASSVLQAGVYIFGVDGGAYTQTQWDTATKVTLPGPNTSISLNY